MHTLSKLKLKFDLKSNQIEIYIYIYIYIYITRPSTMAQVNIGAFRLKVIESIDLVTFTFWSICHFQVSKCHTTPPVTTTIL